jgi:putative ABC transport system permease protein
MTKLFGIPVGDLLLGLVIAVVVALAAVGLLAVRNRVLFRLGVRNVRRRRGRSALIVVGLMLGTTIIAAALTTGDTMSHTIRATAVRQIGETDEIVAAKGAAEDIPGELGQATGTGYFDDSLVAKIDNRLRPSGLVDGVTGVIQEQVALQAPVQRQTEPSVSLFAPDPARMAGFAPIRRVGGGDLSLNDLRPGEAYVNEKTADKLGVSAGDRVLVFAGRHPVPITVREIVRFDGAGTADAAVLVPLGTAQRLLGREGLVKGVLVSNRGSGTSGIGLTDDVVRKLEPTLGPLGLETLPAKRDAIDAADAAGNQFMTFFTTFGTFSIAAGILLIFLIFVMLAAERRGELGIARAVGTRRGHLVQMFLFEGVAYDLAAAVVGALMGALVAYGMVIVMASVFKGENADAGLQVEYSASLRSLVIAFAIGVLLTFVVVAVSAWRVSVMTIASAIRNLPEPGLPKRRRRWILASIGLLLALLLTYGGASAGAATPLMLGVSLLLVAIVPVLKLIGVGERAAYTSCGLTIVVILMLPWSIWEDVFGQLSMNFSTWIVSGLMIVVGAVWVMIYNADVLLRGAGIVLGRFGLLLPVIRMAITYPLRARFRTGATLAMFTLVVFTLVTGTASSDSFNSAFDNAAVFGGGFDVRAGTTAAAPITDLRGTLRHTPGIRSSDFTAVASQSVLAVNATQLGTGRSPETYVARGLDRRFLRHTTFGLGAIARGYGSPSEVWYSLMTQPGLAVVDASVAPRRDNFNFALLPDFKLSGFYYEDGTFDPLPIQIGDPQTGKQLELKVIGILQDNAPLEMVGISSSQDTYEHAFPGRFQPTIHYFETPPGVDPRRAASRLESAFLANGMQAESIEKVVKDQAAAGRTFNRLIEGFMGLGLIVGVAALGVISARAVVERRQQIGVLRAIGFRRGMVQAVFLLESSFVALTSIVAGTVLGLLLAENIIRDTRQQPGWENLTLVVPWFNLGLIFLVVYVVALAATLAPALRASRILPAEALRYQ